MIDYQSVLKRYIRHVADCEGSSFIDDLVNETDPKYEHERISVRFTTEEIAELKRLEAARGISDRREFIKSEIEPTRLTLAGTTLLEARRLGLGVGGHVRINSVNYRVAAIKDRPDGRATDFELTPNNPKK